MSYTVYDIVKSIYASNNNLEDIRSRISAIQNTLSQLRVTNIATLDALTQHFGRLIDITHADEDYISDLAQQLSYCILRPRIESSVTQHDRHAQRLIIDLIIHRDKVFKELKRQSIRKTKPESLDESHRRERVEARSRAVSAAAKSPRLQPVDVPNGAEKTHARRISGIFGNRPPSLALEPGDTINLDGGLPAGGVDEPAQPVADKAPAVEVTVADESQGFGGGGQPPVVKTPSLGRTHRIGATRAVGLQRHVKRESLQQGQMVRSTGDVEDKDAAAVAANARVSGDGARPFGVTLTDGPTRE
jgi:hypothetical protein